MDLAKNDFKTKYAGSALGTFWAFFKPIITILVFWFVFEKGLRSTPVQDFPFILWLMVGIIPWFFFNEAWVSATHCLFEYNYLVKKVKFRVSILPFVKIISALYIHLFFIGIIFLMFIAYQEPLSIYNLQIFYYLGVMIVLLISLSWISSALSVFLKDVTQFIEVALTILFWLTPIFWNYKVTIPEGSRWWLKLNPVFYITDGYRDTFINQIWFWEKPIDTIVFLSITTLLFVVGSIVFVKLRPHFPDVL